MTQFARQLDISSERALVAILAVSGIARCAVRSRSNGRQVEAVDKNQQCGTRQLIRCSVELLDVSKPRAGSLVRRPYRNRD
jgi:hypothetical protein